jgi:hypothetical protein
MGCNSLFLTGLYRSGTTLLDKLLHAHPRISMASQPCSVLFTGFKQRFLDQQGLARRYPLDDLFGERAYQREDFHRFLDQYVCTASELREWMEQLPQPAVMFWRRVGVDLPRVLHPGTFRELLGEVDAQVREAMGKEVAVVGMKEIVCEEYISYLLQQGKRVVVVIRDPRDVICSTNFGAGRRFTGDIRPTLYTLRCWRKSVALTLLGRRSPNFTWCRYEDLVAQPAETLRSISEFLELEPLPSHVLAQPLRDQEGGIWSGNSSFFDETRVHGESVGRYREMLPASVVEYIESCCLPEMKWLGYDLDGEGVFCEEVIEQFEDPFPITHHRFETDYSSLCQHVAEEIERYQLLLSPPAEGLSTQELRAWFLDPVAYETLRAIATHTLSLHVGEG